MVKFFSLTLISLLSFQASFSQLSLHDIERTTEVSVDEVVEQLLSKGFAVNFRQDKIGTTMRLDYPKLNGDLRVEYSKFDEHIEWGFCFDKRFNSNFLTIDNAIKKKYKKVKFFYSNNYKHYVTEYKMGDNYIFVGRRPYFNDANQKIGDYGVIYLTNSYSQFH